MASSLEKRVETLTHEPIMEDRPIDEYHTPKQLLIHTGTTAEITSAAVCLLILLCVHSLDLLANFIVCTNHLILQFTLL